MMQIKPLFLLLRYNKKNCICGFFIPLFEDVIVNKAAHGFCASSLGYPCADRPLSKIVRVVFKARPAIFRC